MKSNLINSLSKEQLRKVVGQVITVDDSKLSKMSKSKLIPHIEELSYNKIKELLK